MITDRQIVERTATNLRAEIDREILLAVAEKLLSDDQIKYYKQQYKSVDDYETRRKSEL